jgi:HAD superfamily hydrolase (TIGR01509 family)
LKWQSVRAPAGHFLIAVSQWRPIMSSGSSLLSIAHATTDFVRPTLAPAARHAYRPRPVSERGPRAILFDMDGTLTRPMLDFPAIKAELGIGDRPILEALAGMPAAERTTADALLDRHERHAAEHSTLNEGCEPLLARIQSLGLRTAIITRNSRACADIVLARHCLAVDVLITRETAPFKPDPTPLLLACQRLGVAPGDAWMVGDGQYDVEAGNAAGIRTIWLSHGRAATFAAKPWRVVSDLPELNSLLSDYLPITRPPSFPAGRPSGAPPRSS